MIRLGLSLFFTVTVTLVSSSSAGFAADATFSKDGERIYVVVYPEPKAALREINLKDQTARKIALTQLADSESLVGITRSDDDKIYCITERKLLTFDPKSRRLTKLMDAPQKGLFEDVAFDPKSRALYLIVNGTTGPLVRLKNGHELVSIWVRRHGNVSNPVFASDGELFYSVSGDLWSGQIRDGGEDESPYLEASRYAPLATLETSHTTPAEMGVSQIAVAHDAIYVELYRIGGSGMGEMLQLTRPATKPDDQLLLYKEMLQSVKLLSNGDFFEKDFCVSPDDSRVFYSGGTKQFLIVGGKTEELHLREE